MLPVQCCSDVIDDLMTSELTDDVATHLAALHIVQRYHDNSASSRRRRPSIRNVQLVMTLQSIA